jgi:cell wall-associated NlpC family hydrolase
VYDGYEGWCQATQLEVVDGNRIAKPESLLAGDWVNTIKINNQSMLVPFGSSLELLQDGKAKFSNYQLSYQGSSFNPSERPKDETSIKEFAYKFLNTPYLWGGRSVFGIDCSGFSQLVYKCLGIPLLRDAYQQATQGEAIGFLEEARCGDLAFFDNEAGKITHVGILLSPNTMIHSSGKVRIDTIDNAGIVNAETGKRTHNLRIIKRMIE